MKGWVVIRWFCDCDVLTGSGSLAVVILLACAQYAGAGHADGTLFMIDGPVRAPAAEMYDQDGDGVPDDLEFGRGTDAYAYDTDGDGVSDREDGCPTSAADTDGDGFFDDWERCWFGDIRFDCGEDADQDGVLNADEQRLGTAPTLPNMTVSAYESFLVVFTPLTH
jgi:hypothetical protein